MLEVKVVSGLIKLHCQFLEIQGVTLVHFS